MAWEARLGLKLRKKAREKKVEEAAKWPGKPVWD